MERGLLKRVGEGLGSWLRQESISDRETPQNNIGLQQDNLDQNAMPPYLAGIDGLDTLERIMIYNALHPNSKIPKENL